MSSPSIFEAFNARFLTEEEVADRFVPSAGYQKLISRNHSLTIGPRGSGKTSLLKMLQVRALNSWTHQSAETYRSKVDFVGIFIPTDIQWFEYLQKLEEFASERSSKYIIDSLIGERVMQAFIDTWEARLMSGDHGFLGITSDYKVEKKMCLILRDLWALDDAHPTIDGLICSLAVKAKNLREFIRREIFNGGKGNEIDLASTPEMFTPKFMDFLPQTIDLFNRTYSDRMRKWALCFDELELAPGYLQKELLGYLRSVTDKLIFKLSMSPFCGEGIELSSSGRQAGGDHDVNIIPLWYPRKRGSEVFTEKLVLSIAQRNGIEIESVVDLFGETPSFVLLDDEVMGNHKNTNLRTAFIIEAAKKDSGWQEYLREKNIDIERLSKLTEKESASLIRKALPVVAFRNYYGVIGQRRSRKTDALYSGWKSFSAICEGNPRWIIGCLNEMFSQTKADGKYIGEGNPIPIRYQLDAINVMRHRFMAKLKTISLKGSLKTDSLSSLVAEMGENIKSGIYSTEFAAEPPQSFMLDKESAKIYHDIIALGLNAGVFVYCPRKNGGVGKELLTNLVNRRLRLSYLLLSEYKVPLRMGACQQLSLLLKSGKFSPEHLHSQSELKFK